MFHYSTVVSKNVVLIIRTQGNSLGTSMQSVETGQERGGQQVRGGQQRNRWQRPGHSANDHPRHAGEGSMQQDWISHQIQQHEVSGQLSPLVTRRKCAVITTRRTVHGTIISRAA